MSLMSGRFTIRGTGRFVITDKVENPGGGGDTPPSDPGPEPESEPPVPPGGYVNITASFVSLSTSTAGN